MEKLKEEEKRTREEKTEERKRKETRKNAACAEDAECSVVLHIPSLSFASSAELSFFLNHVFVSSRPEPLFTFFFFHLILLAASAVVSAGPHCLRCHVLSTSKGPLLPHPILKEENGG